MKIILTIFLLIFTPLLILFAQTNYVANQAFDGINNDQKKKTSKLGISAFANGSKNYMFFTYTMDVERETSCKNFKIIAEHTMYMQDLASHTVNNKFSSISAGIVFYIPIKKFYFAIPLQLGAFTYNSSLFGGYVYRYGGLIQSGLRIGWEFKKSNTFSLSLNPILMCGPIYSNVPDIITSNKPKFGLIGIPRLTFQFKL